LEGRAKETIQAPQKRKKNNSRKILYFQKRGLCGHHFCHNNLGKVMKDGD
jgi:hypothetical protein